MVEATSRGGGAIVPSHIAVKRKATGLTEYYEVRQTPAGPMNIPITEEEYNSKTGGAAQTVVQILGKVKAITEYAVMEAGSYVLSGVWHPTRAAAEKAIKDLGAVAPMYQVVAVTFDDLEGHVPALLAQVAKNRLEEADALSVKEDAGVRALAKKAHPDTPSEDLSHEQRVALANKFHGGK